jgi:hypothetical protein
MNPQDIQLKDIEKVSEDKFIVTPPSPTPVEYSLEKLQSERQILQLKLDSITTKIESLDALIAKLMAK